MVLGRGVLVQTLGGMADLLQKDPLVASSSRLPFHHESHESHVSHPASLPQTHRGKRWCCKRATWVVKDKSVTDTVNGCETTLLSWMREDDNTPRRWNEQWSGDGGVTLTCLDR